jgi:hypothetical protein
MDKQPMKKPLAILLILFLLSACAAPTLTDAPKAADTQLVIPTRMPFPTRIPKSPVFPAVTPTVQPDLLDGIKFPNAFSSVKADWQVIPGNVTAAQMNDAVAQQEGDQVDRANQKVLNGFLLTTIAKADGQVFDVLTPAELVDGKLKELKVKKVEQVPVLSTHAALAEDYFAINFPDAVSKWEAQGAQYEDFKYAAVVTISWATKYGPLRVSYKLSGKYLSEAGKYPGRLEFLKLCAYEQTLEHFSPINTLMTNWYPAPIVGLSGTVKGVSGVMESDAFGWTPMTDFANAESVTLGEIGQAVNGVTIASRETLDKLQAVFDRAFMPMHCAETVLDYKK